MVFRCWLASALIVFKDVPLPLATAKFLTISLWFIVDFFPSLVMVYLVCTAICLRLLFKNAKLQIQNQLYESTSGICFICDDIARKQAPSGNETALESTVQLILSS